MAANADWRNSKEKGKRFWLIGVGALAALLVGYFALQRSSIVEGSIPEAPTFRVREGPLLISVTESGTISSLEQAVIKSEVQGQAQILWLIEEGKQVKEGELLVHLDSSRLEDQLIDQEIRLQNTEASFINARETLKVVKNQTKSDISRAKLEFQFAKEDLVKYTEGDYPKEVKEAQARITIAEAGMAQAVEDLQAKERLAEKDFVTRTELEATRRAYQKAELDLDLANASMELLQKYDYKREVAELRSDIEETEMALERVQLKASADIVQSEANLKAKESEYHRQQGKLDKFLEQIEKTKIYAPTDGLVVYATSSSSSRHGPMRRQEPLEEGQMVRERQEIIHLPTATSVMARVSIHESNLMKVKLGLGVRIKVDAIPDKSFTGRVTHIAPLPDAQSVWMNPDLKVYATEIKIDGDGSELRTGMSCEAQIMIEQYEKTLYVPVQAVYVVNGKPTVFTVEGGEIEERKVEIGLDNNRMIRIASGLEAGEEVLLTPPLDRAAVAEDVALDDSFVEAGPVPSDRRATPGEHDFRPQSVHPGQGGEGMGQMPSEEMRTRFENMSPEQREEMRKRYENMSPEEMQKMRQRMQGGQGRRGDGPPHQ